ncbi:MAG: hypothetical protein K0R38_5063 [Polyangiaceae bacterium]|nr:hypothetical protein [Polyangiaceae bacterium]
MAEGTRLLSGPRRNPSAGSNPALSATTPALCGSSCFVGCPNSQVLALRAARPRSSPKPCSPSGLRAAGEDTHSRGGERDCDECESLRRLRHHERRGEPEYPVAEAVEVAVAAPVGDAAPLMVAAVHLHDEPRGGGEKVRDIATDGNLTAESDAECAAAARRLRDTPPPARVFPWRAHRGRNAPAKANSRSRAGAAGHPRVGACGPTPAPTTRPLHTTRTALRGPLERVGARWHLRSPGERR